ncbi:Rne/Rng family ribonuclease [Roseicyclus sp. F158]|uniref:Ribonuclease E n=1 Tax=Tropicimonas omnivorans TaxID=3075590 RepID=A0ABU3DHZ4_9RHOB|nr:Rne/Rng family ribonuclease [Roseicyclus sp. F158]MDT0683314.1 Rne/Rng family ribonuclease [Roseicyclus sp. F158]
MAKKMLIDATHAEETRVVVVDGNKVEEFDFETVNRRQLAGNIYLAKVTRVEPSLQAAFVDYGGNRHGFLAFSEVHPDYYQIPKADRDALLAEEMALAEAEQDESGDEDGKSGGRSSGGRSRSRSRSRSQKASTDGDAVATQETSAEGGPSGMDVVDLGDEEDGDAPAQVPDAPEPPVAADTDGDEGASRDTRGDDIESVADEDVSEEIRAPKPRARRYKIQEVIKVRQILLVQVVKEERGNKGAALTTYLSLAGRYCVLMPNTARGGGISRKITNATDRKKLKEIASGIEVPKGAGLIIRTAGAQRTKAEIKRDYEYLLRLWEQIRELTLKSIAPAPIYEEGNLIKRSIRDLYNREIDEVWVEGETGYRVAKDFMKMIMPSHAKNVKQYTDPMPLFARHQVESYLSGMFNPTVQLKSGGYIVIGITEALVAIDVNSGRATKEGSIEETATKTNLEAAEEVARQLRLRDLAGLIVIDFIDMEERKNNAAVEKRFKDKLKTDRARIQVGRISGFGLMEMSRQRLRPGMLEATTQPCPHCHGTGLLRSDDSLGLIILRQIEEEGTRDRTREVLIKAPTGIVNFLMNDKREHIAGIEARYGLAVRIESDPMLISPDYTIEKFKTATRNVAEVTAPVISVDTSDMPELLPEEEELEDATDNLPGAEAPAEVEVQGGSDAETPSSEEDKPKKKRRRRRRRGKGGGNGDQQGGDQQGDTSETGAQGESSDAETASEEQDGSDAGSGEEPQEEQPKKSRSRTRSRSRSRKPAVTDAEQPAEPHQAPDETPAPAAVVEAEAIAPEGAPQIADAASGAGALSPRMPEEASAPQPERDEAPAPTTPAPVEHPVPAEEPAPVASAPEPEPQPEPAAEDESETKDSKPKRRGWWSLAR